MKKTIILLSSPMEIISSIQAQEFFAVGDIHLKSKTYKRPTDPAVLKSFKKFPAEQIYELMSNYGIIDILGLDSGQSKPPKSDQRIQTMGKW